MSLSVVVKLVNAPTKTPSQILIGWRDLVMHAFELSGEVTIVEESWTIATADRSFGVKFNPAQATIEKSPTTVESVEILAALFCAASEGAAKISSGAGTTGMSLKSGEIYVYTDGSVNTDTKTGGCAAVMVRDGQILGEVSSRYERVTSPQMELAGAITGLEKCAAMGVRRCTVVSDSEYVIKGYTMWLNGWIEKGWRTVNNTPVKNANEWMALRAVVTSFERVDWIKVLAHSGDTHNERADTLAKNASEGRVVS